MMERNKKNIVEKYLNATSNLEEEDNLFKSGNEDEDLNTWFTYAKTQKKRAPKDIQVSIWNSIQRRRRVKRLFWYGVSTAASFALILTLLVSKPKNNEMTLAEKKAILDQALSMFPEEQSQNTEYEVIYEDELMIIYYNK